MKIQKLFARLPKTFFLHKNDVHQILPRKKQARQQQDEILMIELDYTEQDYSLFQIERFCLQVAEHFDLYALLPKLMQKQDYHKLNKI